MTDKDARQALAIAIAQARATRIKAISRIDRAFSKAYEKAWIDYALAVKAEKDEKA